VPDDAVGRRNRPRSPVRLVGNRLLVPGKPAGGIHSPDRRRTVVVGIDEVGSRKPVHRSRNRIRRVDRFGHRWRPLGLVGRLEYCARER